MSVNFHTHTYRCKHSNGDVQDIVNYARRLKVTKLGISDHTPLPDNRWLGVRMHIDDLDEYTSAIENAQQRNVGIKLFKGMECDWAPEYKSFYITELLEKRNYDYIIGGVHWFPFAGEWKSAFDIRTPDQLKHYTEFYINGMHSGIYTFMAHPDVFGCAYDWDTTAEQCAKSILKAAEELNLPLEINGNGFRRATVITPQGERNAYPLKPFWQLAADYKIRVFCNSDAHAPEEVLAGIPEGMAIAAEHSLPVLDEVTLRS